MAVHKLVLDDFVDTDYSLFAIHCDLEDYRLAFHINCALNTNLKRTKEDIDFNDNEASFSLFEWENTNLKTTWNLIKNSCKIELKSQGEGLFAGGSENTTKVVALLEDYPSANFFLKIEGREKPSQKIISMLSKIPDINMAYSIDLDTIKSKEYLILD